MGVKHTGVERVGCVGVRVVTAAGTGAFTTFTLIRKHLCERTVDTSVVVHY